MIVVHHLATSQSERIVWLCEELGLAYEVKRYERHPETKLAPAAYKALHPMGVAPVIADGDLMLAESGAICDYLTRKYGDGGLVPAVDHSDFAEHLFWFHWSNGTFMAALVAQLAVMLATDGRPRHTFVADRVALGWRMVEDRLARSPFFGGEALTTADVMMVYCLTTARGFRGTTIDDKPHLLAYLRRIGERPAYRAAMARAEPGREPLLT